MKGHFVFDDTEFELQFENGTLSPKLFSHEAHLRLAWIHIKKYGEVFAINAISDQLRAYTQEHGAPEKFNMTLTVAAVKAVSHFYHKSKSRDFRGFMTEFPRLKSHFKDLMAAHYSFDIYNLPEAKTKFLAPDLHPFE